MMKNKFLFVLPLFIAYLLMLSHDVIPHHHHKNLVEAEHHHNSEHGDHHHHDGETGAHEHTMHFVHSPEFGNYIPATHLTIDVSLVYLFNHFVFAADDLLALSEINKKTELWLDENPPPLLDQFSSSLDFRGPPKQIFA